MSFMPTDDANFRTCSQSEIELLIAGLDSVTEGELGVSMLVACGERAVPSLRSFLLWGSPKSVYNGRQRAVKALSELGAVSVLIEYMTAEKHIADPALRYSEEAVENTAARALEKWKTDEVFAALLRVIERRPLRGAVEVIGTFGRKEAVPALIRHLEDDIARPAAEESLMRLRSVAIDELIAAARSPSPSGGHELPGSLLRRQSALKVLSAGALSTPQWKRLRILMYESDPLLSIRAAGIALAVGYRADTAIAVQILLDGLNASDWIVIAEAEELLLENYHTTCSAVEAEIELRRDTADLRTRKLLSLLQAIKRYGEVA